MVSAPYPQLSNAPITEAILDINVETKSTIGAADDFAKRVADTHPAVLPLRTTRAIIAPDADQTALSHSVVGKICWNSEKTRAVQARVNGFTVNHVKNYESWAVLRAEAERLWIEYMSILRPTKVVGLGLRYINLISIPPTGELSQYVETRPRLGPKLPQEMSNFFMRVEVPFSPSQTALITQTTVPSVFGTQTRGMILDIHAVSTQKFDPGSLQIWNELDRLREIKNECFFESLQEQTWRKYQ
jgi:uncharacterized protein (TIGR04255 family)